VVRVEASIDYDCCSDESLGLVQAQSADWWVPVAHGGQRWTAKGGGGKIKP
jgi:hypothetical protein